MTLSLPLPAPRRAGPRMGIRVDLRLNPRVDARGRVNLRNSGSQTRQSHRRPVVPELANTLQGQDHYPAPGLADRSVPGRTTAWGLRSRLGDGAPDPSPFIGTVRPVSGTSAHLVVGTFSSWRSPTPPR